MPREQAKGVADCVAAAFADPVLALPYLHSIQFGADLVELSAQVCSVLESEARCLSIPSPVYVLGDIHGNYTDLRFFADSMWPMGMGLTPGSFLFLGDYVDRGQSSLECIAYLFAQKLLHPKKLFLIRGNHETRAINGLEAHYGAGCLLSQCKARFGSEEGYIVWHQINHAFDRLPLAAVIDNDIFCVHGGLPRPIGSEKTLESIQKIPRTALLDVLDKKYYEENIQMSMVSDMLWGDPVPEESEPTMDSRGFGKSLRGGVAVSFGEKAIENFLQQHKFSRILRAHEAKLDGVAVSKSARVITIFSTSKDHGLGEDAKCGCLLIDHGKITAINRSPQARKTLQLQRRRSTSFQNELHTAAAMGSGTRLEYEACNFGGEAGLATAGGARQNGSRGHFQGSIVGDIQSSAQADTDEDDTRAAQATTHASTDADDTGSDSTDDEDDQSQPPPRRPRTRVLSQTTRTATTSTRSPSTRMHSRAAVASSVALVHSPPPVTPASSIVASERVVDGGGGEEEEEEEEDNNQNDDF
ncbi:hypothetical protein Gpo141_00004838 [Globisporangium polare]